MAENSYRISMEIEEGQAHVGNLELGLHQCNPDLDPEKLIRGMKVHRDRISNHILEVGDGRKGYETLCEDIEMYAHMIAGLLPQGSKIEMYVKVPEQKGE